MGEETNVFIKLPKILPIFKMFFQLIIQNVCFILLQNWLPGTPPVLLFKKHRSVSVYALTEVICLRYMRP